VSIRDARVRDDLHQLESELVRNELVMRQTGLGGMRPTDPQTRLHPSPPPILSGIQIRAYPTPLPS
jgi:hypothetical protein